MAQNLENPKSSGKVCVLIIEEKSDLRAFFMSILTKSGNFEVKNAATPIEALEILSKEAKNIQLIIFDWHMKEIPGYIFAQKIKNEVNFDHIDLIVCSDVISADDTFLMSEIEIYYTMPKVVSAGDFLVKMEEARAAYTNTNMIYSKLKELQHLINESNLKDIEVLMNDPAVTKEILENFRYAYLFGEVKILNKKYNEAIEFLKSKLQENKVNENLRTLSTLGKALCLIGSFEEALTIFERLAAKSPNNLGHKVMVGDALLGLDDFSSAEEKYKEVLGKDPSQADALKGMVKLNTVSGNYDQAKSFFDKIEGNFESKSLAIFFNNRGVALVKKGKPDEAILFYENALQFFNKLKGHVYFNLGMAYYRSGNITSALSCFQAAMAQDELLTQKKKILQELRNKGAEKFTAEYKSRTHKKKKRTR